MFVRAGLNCDGNSAACGTSCHDVDEGHCQKLASVRTKSAHPLGTHVQHGITKIDLEEIFGWQWRTAAVCASEARGGRAEREPPALEHADLAAVLGVAGIPSVETNTDLRVVCGSSVSLVIRENCNENSPGGCGLHVCNGTSTSGRLCSRGYGTGLCLQQPALACVYSQIRVGLLRELECPPHERKHIGRID